jgi:transcriptional regulator with XRE-family HTH domain
MDFTPGQCRAARALIGWSQDQLASASKVAKATIANFELGKRTPYDRTLDDLLAALEAAGIEFTNSGQPGVKLRANYDPKTGLVGPDPFQGGDGFQRVVTSELRRPLRSKEPPE